MNIEKVLGELTLEEKASLCSGHDFWHTESVERLGIPSVMLCDGPHGLRKQQGEGDHMGINVSIETVCYPTASALAASFDTRLLSKLGHTLGQECQSENVGMLLGPGVNMKRSPLCGRNFEYFSEDPYMAGELASSYINGLQDEGIACCVKHFAANNQETRRMSGSSNMDERTLHEIYLPAFEAAVKKGKVRSIMCAYNAINGDFCAENKELLTDILRKDWGFDGMVVTDWGAVKKRVTGLLAGLDLEMPGGAGVQDAQIAEAVRNGSFDEKVLDEAVRNVLKFVNDHVEQRKADTTIDREACSRLSGEFASECAVLLKNDNLLPLKEDVKAVFIGEFARAPRYQGAGSSHINVPHSISAMEIMGDKVSYVEGYDVHKDGIDQTQIDAAVEAAKQSDVAVIFAGLPNSFETEGADRLIMSIPVNQNALISAVAAVQPNTVVVLHGGSAMELPWVNEVAGILLMYLGGERVGEAAVDLLYGNKVPSGKLAETWPVKYEDNPSYLNFPGVDGQVDYREGVFIGYRYYDKKKMEVLFPFGHGLSYTTFAYSNPKLEKEKMMDTDTLNVSCTITNTGNVKAKEAVQLYISDKESSVPRPVRELKGFTKIELAPGESKEVTFTLDRRTFAYYEPRIHDWMVESGEFAVEIGSSSRDIRLSETVEVTGTKEIPMVYTETSCVGDLMKTAKGRAVVEQMMAGRAKRTKEDEEEDKKNMGEGSEKMAQKMMFEMPLSSVVTFGAMTREQLQGLLVTLNQ